MFFFLLSPLHINWILFSQCWTHFSALSLFVARSADVHGSCNKGHLNKCSIVCGSVPQSHMVSLEGLYPHLLSVTLALSTPVLSGLRHFHFAQLSSAPGGRCSLATIPIVVEGGRLLFISSHIVNLASLVVVSSSRGLTHLRKLFLDFRRFWTGGWLNIGWRSSISCCCRCFILAADLLMAGGEVPAKI